MPIAPVILQQSDLAGTEQYAGQLQQNTLAMKMQQDEKNRKERETESYRANLQNERFMNGLKIDKITYAAPFSDYLTKKIKDFTDETSSKYDEYYGTVIPPAEQFKLKAKEGKINTEIQTLNDLWERHNKIIDATTPLIKDPKNDYTSLIPILKEQQELTKNGISGDMDMDKFIKKTQDIDDKIAMASKSNTPVVSTDEINKLFKDVGVDEVFKSNDDGKTFTKSWAVSPQKNTDIYQTLKAKWDSSLANSTDAKGGVDKDGNYQKAKTYGEQYKDFDDFYKKNLGAFGGKTPQIGITPQGAPGAGGTPLAKYDFTQPFKHTISIYSPEKSDNVDISGEHLTPLNKTGTNPAKEIGGFHVNSAVLAQGGKVADEEGNGLNYDEKTGKPLTKGETNQRILKYIKEHPGNEFKPVDIGTMRGEGNYVFGKLKVGKNEVYLGIPHDDVKSWIDNDYYIAGDATPAKTNINKVKSSQVTPSNTNKKPQPY